MKIHLPNSAYLGNIEPFIKGFETSGPQELTITANKKWISVHPMVLCMVASLGQEANQVEFQDLEAKSSAYLERMGLFKFLGTDSGINIKRHDPSGRFIPLSRIQTSAQLSDFLKEMTPLLHLEPTQADAIKYVLSELVRNVLEHAETDYGAIVSAQYYKKSNAIKIGIVDRGIGIMESIRYSHPVTNDLEAIRLALTPGITGTTSREGGTEQNAGAGLFFVKSMAAVNRNFFVVYSGDSLYKLLKLPETKKIKLNADPFADRHSKQTKLPYWQGTAIGIDLSLDDNYQFLALLELLKDAYAEAIRERKKLKYKQAKFI